VKIYFVESKDLSLFSAAGWRKTRGGENEGKSRDVIENKRIKNVHFTASRDVIEKQAVITILSRC
jgi:hypothetical protein